MYRKILVATDGSVLSDKGVREAAQLAKSLGAGLLILHVRSPLDIPHHPEGGALSRFESTIKEEIERDERDLLGAAKDIAASVGILSEVAFIASLQPAEAIVATARDRQCDLIVMATRIRQGIPGYFVKSETQKVLAQTGITVLVVR